MITLGGVVISNNMYLKGVEQANPFLYSQVRAIDGTSHLISYNNPGGRTFTLGSSQTNNMQGLWCQDTLDALQALRESDTVLTLDYNGEVYNVKIVSMEDIEQFMSKEPKSSTKKYTGTITLIEV